MIVKHLAEARSTEAQQQVSVCPDESSQTQITQTRSVQHLNTCCFLEIYMSVLTRWPVSYGHLNSLSWQITKTKTIFKKQILASKLIACGYSTLTEDFSVLSVLCISIWDLDFLFIINIKNIDSHKQLGEMFVPKTISHNLTVKSKWWHWGKNTTNISQAAFFIRPTMREFF